LSATVYFLAQQRAEYKRVIISDLYQWMEDGERIKIDSDYQKIED